jgi:hypothetical protein
VIAAQYAGDCACVHDWLDTPAYRGSIVYVLLTIPAAESIARKISYCEFLSFGA